MRRSFRRYLFEELSSAGGAIISWEGLSGLSYELVCQLRQDLEEVGFREFYVVLYVRDPADMYLSATQQRLKTAHHPQFVQSPEQFRYKFLESAQTWERAFPDRIITRRFPPSTGEDVVVDFAGLVKKHLEVSLPKSLARMNTTLSAEAMQILQDYREAFWPDNDGFLSSDTAWLVRFLEQSTSEIPQTKPALNDEVAALIRANHSTDAQEFLVRYGIDLGLGDPKPVASFKKSEKYRVKDVVASVDPETERDIFLKLARIELGRRPQGRPLPIDLAAQVYRTLPRSLRPPAMDSWLRRIAGRTDR